MAGRKPKQNKGGTISKADLDKLPEKARRQIEAQLGKVEQAEERAVSPRQKATVAKRKRSILARIGTRLRLIAATKKYKVQARNLNKAPRKTIKVRARTEVDALNAAKKKLGAGFDQFRVKNPSRGVYLVSARKNPVRRHLPGATPKQQRQYEHILEGELKSSKSKKRSKSIAAATVRARAAGNPKSSIKKVAKSVVRTFKGAVSGIKKASKNAPRKSRKRSGKVLSKSRKPNSSIAEGQRRQFAGHFDGYRTLYYPKSNPPKNPSKLGELKSIRTNHADFTPVNGSMWLVRDEHGHLHIGSTREGLMFDGPIQDLGAVQRIEYLERKPHLGDYELTEYYHRMGEENGRKPHLWSDGQGGLVFRGGDYRIESRGIVN